MPEIRAASDADRELWNRFVSSRPEASISHLFEWKAVFERAYARRCHYLLLPDGEDDCAGVLPLVHMRGPLGGNRLVSLPYLDRGGPVVASSSLVEQLQDGALELCKRLGARGIEWRGGPGGDTESMEACTRFRFVLPLGDRDEVWKRIGPKVRNQVRKAEKEGLVTERAGVETLEAFFRILARNMHRLGSPVHSRRFFRSIFEQLDESAELYVTYDRDRHPVAGGVALRFGDVLTVPWASSEPEARSGCPNHSLYWKVLEDAVDRGCREFDFGRSSVGTGTYQFKKQWNAEPVPLVWTSFDRKGRSLPDASLSPQEHSTMVKLWSSLPLGLATRLGPFVRRQLPN